MYKRHVVFSLKDLFVCEKNKKTVSSLADSISQAENRVEIHYDSLDLHFKATALEKKLVAKIVSITRR